MEEKRENFGKYTMLIVYNLKNLFRFSTSHWKPQFWFLLTHRERERERERERDCECEKKMGAICSTATPAPQKRETKFDVTKSPPGSPTLNHKASLKGWLDGLDVAGDTKRNLHDIYTVDVRFLFPFIFIFRHFFFLLLSWRVFHLRVCVRSPVSLRSNALVWKRISSCDPPRSPRFPLPLFTFFFLLYIYTLYFSLLVHIHIN